MEQSHRSLNNKTSLISRPDERKREEAALARSAQIKSRPEDSPSSVSEDNRFHRVEHTYNNNDDLTKTIHHYLHPYKNLLNGSESSKLSSGTNGVRSYTGNSSSKNPSKLTSKNVSEKNQLSAVISQNGIRQTVQPLDNPKFTSTRPIPSSKSKRLSMLSSDNKKIANADQQDSQTSSADSPIAPLSSPNHSNDKHHVISNGPSRNETSGSSSKIKSSLQNHCNDSSVRSTSTPYSIPKLKRATEPSSSETDRNLSTSPSSQTSASQHSRSSSKTVVTSKDHLDHRIDNCTNIPKRNPSPDQNHLSPKSSVPIDSISKAGKSSFHSLSATTSPNPKSSPRYSSSSTPTKSAHPPNGLIHPSAPVTLTMSTNWSPAVVTTSVSSSVVTSSSSSLKSISSTKTGSAQKKHEKRMKLLMPNSTTKSDLNDIFKDMECPQLHTAIQTPQKPNVERFPFGISDKPITECTEPSADTKPYKYINGEECKENTKVNEEPTTKYPFSKRNHVEEPSHISPPPAALSPLSPAHQPPSSLSFSTAAPVSTITTTATSLTSPATSASPLTFGIVPRKGPRTPPMSPPPDSEEEDHIDGGHKIPFTNTDSPDSHEEVRARDDRSLSKDIPSVQRDGVHQDSDVDLKSDLDLSSDSDTEQPVQMHKTSCGQSGKGKVIQSGKGKVIDIGENRLPMSQLSSSSGSSSSSSDASSDEDDDRGSSHKAVQSPVSVARPTPTQAIQTSDSSGSDNSSDSSSDEDEDNKKSQCESDGQVAVDEETSKGRSSAERLIGDTSTITVAENQDDEKWALSQFMNRKASTSPIALSNSPVKSVSPKVVQPVVVNCLSPEGDGLSEAKIEEDAPKPLDSDSVDDDDGDDENEESDSEISSVPVKKRTSKVVKEKAKLKELTSVSLKDVKVRDKSLKIQSSANKLKKDKESVSKELIHIKSENSNVDKPHVDSVKSEKKKCSGTTDDEIDVVGITTPKKGKKANSSRALDFNEDLKEDDTNKTHNKTQHSTNNHRTKGVYNSKTFPSSKGLSMSVFANGGIDGVDLVSISRPPNLLSPVHQAYCSPSPAISPKPLPSFQTSFSPKPGTNQPFTSTPIPGREVPPIVTLHQQKDGSSQPRILTRIMQEFLSEKQLSRLNEKRERRRLKIKSETIKLETLKSEPVPVKSEIPDKKVCDHQEARVPPIAVENHEPMTAINSKKPEGSSRPSVNQSQSLLPSKPSIKSRSNKRKGNDPPLSPTTSSVSQSSDSIEKPHKKTKHNSVLLSSSSSHSPKKLSVPPGKISSKPEPLPSSATTNGELEDTLSSLPNNKDKSSKFSSLTDGSQTAEADIASHAINTKSDTASCAKTRKRPSDEEVTSTDSKKQRASNITKPQSANVHDDEKTELTLPRHRRDRRDSTESRGSRKSSSSSSNRKSRHSTEATNKTTVAIPTINNNSSNNNNDKVNTDVKELPTSLSHTTNGPLEPPNIPNGISISRSNPRFPPPPAIETQLETTESYLDKAKTHKRKADTEKQKRDKVEPYLRSGLYFYLAGLSMESLKNADKSYTMYQETSNLLCYASNLRNSTANEIVFNDKQKKVHVMLIQLRSFLFHRMYILRKSYVLKNRKSIEIELNKLQSGLNTTQSGQTKPPAPSPHQNSWNKTSTGTPSPMSLPASSPAGSVSSQGSGEQVKSNGIPSSGSTPITSPCPGSASLQQKHQLVVQNTKKYTTYTANLVEAHELWEQANTNRTVFEDFFTIVDNACGPITFHSEPRVVVRYMTYALILLNSDL